jgi:thiosulfate sulfurtransferase
MTDFRPIDIVEAQSLLTNPTTVLVDIRDAVSYEQGHIPGAISLGAHNIDTFMESTDKSRPVVCYCYHGISSQSAGRYLAENGFVTVYSLNGGYERWKEECPNEI